ncbi:hypothetical protein OU997_01570 [Pseudomonas sp. SL4(2022)]|uniref:hypothetical protein n=1 Tax=Pseudomonas sp. SL4(2022) TaxID=2994661 RepID=UPI0022717151|nr:hypothetical protein [Pseudomonas sp. SL4(2022)]WAC44919.1 hypothetical protein OU997_01570 [Pseudomonas sp. SL4(2022)]
MRIAVAHNVSERKRSDALQAALYDIYEATHSARELSRLFQQGHLILGELLRYHLHTTRQSGGKRFCRPLNRTRPA